MSAPKPESGPYTILVVDDSAEVRSFLAALLEHEGYVVNQAANGKEAQVWCRETDIDLIITDIVMPEQEGLETIRMIRQTWPHIPVIAVSGSGDQYLDIAKIFGAEAVFCKPIVSEAILREVRRLVPPPL
jgi:CheY-like chemotaxis protein